MAIEQIDQANPPAVASDLPCNALVLTQCIESGSLDSVTLEDVRAFRRAADFIAAAMIFLKDNVLLERSLEPDDIKHRLLGHWGTCPGLNLVYAHLNLVIQKYEQSMMLLVGPGHGAPAILACNWLDQSLERVYPEYARNYRGLHQLVSQFSVPGGLPSHVNAQTPGTIHEGGELGYVLSVAFGSVMDKPDLISVVVVGDGEAETGPTAAAWHACKYIDPAGSGAVIPILHVNGFKISERTIFGCMDDRELACLFSGYGYKPCIVDDLGQIDQDLHTMLCWAVDEIHQIQRRARAGHPMTKPRWPMIILRTPKGWGCPKKSHGELIEGSFRAHQVPLPGAKTDPLELQALENWLLSYRPIELLPNGEVIDRIKRALPVNRHLRLGQNEITCNGRQLLEVPDWNRYAVAQGSIQSALSIAANLLDETLVLNKHSLRVFSPDELVSNKLSKIFEHTGRSFQWDQFAMHKGGQVIEILSEHTCQGLMQGYIMSGCAGIFPTYESFLPIVATMMIQYSKFLKVSKETPWRKDLNSLTYISTSTWTRQEHNGLSHQNPGFIGSVLQTKPEIGRIYLPPDANTFLSTLAHCLRSKNYVNLIIGSKAPQVVWLSPDEAHAHCKAGAGVWRFASSHGGLDPDIVLVGIGADLMFEVIAAAAYLRDLVPSLAVRVVNVTDLMILSKDGAHPHALSEEEFDALFTADRPIHFNYHGYATELQGLLFGRPKLERMTIESYREEGTTTTPFDMVLRNRCSRYHVATAAIRGAAKHDPSFAMESIRLLAHVQKDVSRIQQYIYKHGVDPPGMYDPPVFAAEGPRRALTGRDLPERRYLMLPEIHFPKLPPWLSLSGGSSGPAANGSVTAELHKTTKEHVPPREGVRAARAL